MRLVLISGGFGTRIGSRESGVPKCMTPIRGRPLLAYQLEWAFSSGITEVIICAGFLGAQVRDYVDHSPWRNHVCVVIEEEPLGTAGCCHKLNLNDQDRTWVIYGDLLLDLSLKPMLNWHLKQAFDASIYVHPNDHPFDSDLIRVGDDGQLEEILHKPHRKSLSSKNLVNGGVYLIEPHVFKRLRPAKSDWVLDVFEPMIRSGQRIGCYQQICNLRDIGVKERLDSVNNRDFLFGKAFNVEITIKEIDFDEFVRAISTSKNLAKYFVRIVRKINAANVKLLLYIACSEKNNVEFFDDFLRKNNVFFDSLRTDRERPDICDKNIIEYVYSRKNENISLEKINIKSDQFEFSLEKVIKSFDRYWRVSDDNV